ncbi:MAG TPA: malto-oligosyltrehalose synthase [Steroidobacteraceae bacterium]|jgi:(1->4)-alpha-D-glucan 1-alpha-D-glucosylmutase|nr:malto-oligosyltrehalose synthase [Steroidobacteraceae bacterium]
MIPRATYRLQLNSHFGFDRVAQLAEYLQQLGVSHAYLSPYLKARPGSPHGYDIVDHRALNPELGDEAAFRRFTAALQAHALGHILDFVPNHMGVGGADNPLWLEVLEWGPDAPHAGWFDIEWDPERRYLHDKLLVPVLGDQYGIELERGVLRLKFDEQEGSFSLWAYDTHRLPIWPPDYARILPDGLLGLEELADAFAWLPNSRGQMPRRAAELKAQLAAQVHSHPEALEALRAALRRFEGEPGEGVSWRPLHELIQTQHWRLAHFRVAADDINYRRFFNINDLAGLRMELPEVFEHAHQRILQLVQDGTIDGLRIDHIDGLFDPKGYLLRLQERLDAVLGASAPERGFYLVVEKILSAHERLREDWPIHGTTGYDFLNQVLSLLVDPLAEGAFTDSYVEFTGERRGYAETVRLSKLHIMDNEMAGELNTLARELARLARQNPRTADFTQNLLRRATKELIACFPVYRTYVDGSGTLDGADQRDLSWALSRARRYETEIDPSVFAFLEQVLTGSLLQQPRTGFSHETLLRCAMRLQQYSGPVDAKGMEDTAFYRYNRFIALNEVGGDPDRFGGTLAAFHRTNLLRAQRWPHSMLTLATHDTKRGADARARLAALSEFAAEWRAQLPVWSRILRGPTAQSDAADRPDRNDEYLLYQVLLGSWPCELLGGASPDGHEPDGQALRAYAERVRAAMTKSMREARLHTNWAVPNSEYEEAMGTLIDAALTGNRAGAFLAAFLPFVQPLAALGVHNSLIQSVVALTAPGVPDLYNGTELWDLSMVDPDNRRAVDYELRGRLLARIAPALQRDRAGCIAGLLRDWHDGGIKLAVITTLLQHRREHAALYGQGDYQPLQGTGARAEELCAYARSSHDDSLITAVARFPRRREQQGFDADATLVLPAGLQRPRWRELLTGRVLQPAGESFTVAALFEILPVAVLVPEPR